MKKIILVPPNISFGDVFSVVGLSYYLLEHYDKVYIYIGQTHIIGYRIPDNIIDNVSKYINHHFRFDPLFNDRIIITSDAESLINNGEFGEFHICNTLTGDWSGPNKIFYGLPNIDNKFYFNDENPLNNKLNIPEELICSPNKHLPSSSLSINHLFYYELVGLNNNVRMHYFNYVRNLDVELVIKNEILNKHGILDGNYNIINDPENHSSSLSKYITNNYPIININYLSDNPCYLLSLLEGAKTIHFIEGSNVNFFYHAQFKGIFKYYGVINFHVWLRNRNWSADTMRLDYAWTMMNTPKLDNWDFIF